MNHNPENKAAAKKTILSFDVDMTLMDHKDMKIPSSALKALDLLRNRYYIVIATGRDMDAYYSIPYRDQIRPDGIIHLNGAKVTAGDTVLYHSKMDRETKEAVFSFAGSHGLAVGVTIKDKDYFTNPEIVKKVDLENWGSCGRQFYDIKELIDMDITALCYMGGKEGRELIEKEFPQFRLPPFASGLGADIIERKNSKARGLEMLCEHFQVPIESTYAFGDSMNDIEILQAAGTGVAMGNAKEPLKEIADFIAEPIDQDGVWKACVALGLINEVEE